MNIWLGRSALALGFAYFHRASCKQSPIEKLDQQLLQVSDSDYEAYLLHSVLAASAGKNYFKIEDSPSEDCIRTAKAIMQSSAKPSTTVKTLHAVEQSCTKAAKNKSNGHFQVQVRTTCKNINEEMKKWPYEFSQFEELKRNVEIPKPAKNYVYEVPSDQNINDWINSVPLNHDDPEMLKFYIVIQFQVLMIPATSDKYRLDIVGTARAIEQLSQNVTFKSTVDDVFTKALEDYTGDIFNQNIDRYAAARGPEFAKKVDRYFLENVVLKEEYQKIKKQILDELRSASPVK